MAKLSRVEDSSLGRHADTMSRAAFERAFSTHYSTLCLVASAIVGRSSAEDAVQDAALVALDRLDRFTPGTDFRAWMSAIVRGVAKNHRRSSVRRVRRHAALADRGDPERRSAAERAENPAAARVPGDASAVDVKLSGEFDVRVRNAVDELEPLQRACLLLKTVSEHSYAQISVMLAIPEGTARSHVLRARRRLMSSLSDAPDGESRSAAVSNA